MAKGWAPVAASVVASLVAVVLIGTVFQAFPSGRGSLLVLSPEDRSVHLVGAGCLGLSGGTGTLIGADRILTSGHVANGVETLDALGVGGLSAPARVSHIDTKLDIAVLRLGPTFDYSELNFGDADVGDSGWFYVRDADGIVAAKPYRVERRIRAQTENVGRSEIVERRSLQLHADVERGDSGAVLFSETSRGVGVVWSTSRRLGAVGYATRGDEITAVLEAERTEPSGPLRCN